MRILVFSQAVWNTTNSFGNTITNWFDGWEGTSFFHFYARHQEPDTDIAEEYYTVSAVEILKCALRGKRPGRILKKADISKRVDLIDHDSEQKQISRLHKKSNQLIYWAMEKVWLSRKWINNTFNLFIDHADPDIIFAFATNSYILEPAIKHIKAKKPSVKVVLYIADDILAKIDKNAWYRRGYLKKGIDYCISEADLLYGASVEMCEKYSKIYGKKIMPLYKGCSFEMPCKKKNNNPVRFVYAGNLMYGRSNTLKGVFSALSDINKESTRAVLEIYSNTTISDEARKQYDGKNVFFMGARPYQEIKRIMNEADVVLHVESFEKDQIEKVRYSFSTKLIDCLQSGSTVVGIGPDNIASIEYLRNVDGVTVINQPERIEEAIRELLHSDIYEKALATREYAIRTHDIKIVRQKLRKDFEELLSNDWR